MNIDQRTETRTANALEAVVRMNGEMISCRLKDISTKGAKISSVSPLITGAKISLMLDPFGSILGEVAWNFENTSGIKFNDRPEIIETVLLGLASYAIV